MKKTIIIFLFIQISIFSENSEPKKKPKKYSFEILFGQGKILNPKDLEDAINDTNSNSPEKNLYLYQNSNNEARRSFELTRLVNPHPSGFYSENQKLFFEFLGKKNTSFGFSLEQYNLYIKNYLNYNFIPLQVSRNPSRDSNYPYEIFYYGINEGKLIQNNIFSVELTHYFEYLKTDYFSPYIKLYGLTSRGAGNYNGGISLGSKIYITEDYSFLFEGY